MFSHLGKRARAPDDDYAEDKVLLRGCMKFTVYYPPRRQVKESARYRSMSSNTAFRSPLLRPSGLASCDVFRWTLM